MCQIYDKCQMIFDVINNIENQMYDIFFNHVGNTLKFWILREFQINNMQVKSILESFQAKKTCRGDFIGFFCELNYNKKDDWFWPQTQILRNILLFRNYKTNEWYCIFLGTAVIMRNINSLFDHRRPNMMILSLILRTITFLTIIKIMIFHYILYNTYRSSEQSLVVKLRTNIILSK